MKNRITTYRRVLLLLAGGLQITACGGGGGGGSSTGDASDTADIRETAVEIELVTQQEYFATPVTLRGAVVDSAGSRLGGASIRAGDITVTADADGRFEFERLARGNRLLTVTAPGYRAEHVPVHMARPAVETIISMEPVVLSASEPYLARMLFGGDVAFGRRFLDTDESTPRDQLPPDDPEALIQVSDPEPGTRAVVGALRPWFQEADFGVINLESPVTDNPATPHEEKPYSFFTLPGSVPALTWLGIDYVSLGNNHVYDYLEPGLSETLAHLDTYGISYSGAGLNSTQAFTAHRISLSGSPYGFLSMTSVSGSQYSLNFVADDTKGGAADLRSDEEVVAAIRNEQDAGYIPVVQYHTGREYIYEPTEYVLGRMQLATENEVPLIVTHHPHVAQGVGMLDNTFALLGLGNLAFDQDRLETMLGLMGRVDMDGPTVAQVRLLPVYLEDFIPRQISGTLASRFLRRIGEFSHAYGALVYPYQGQGWVDSPDGTDAVRLQRTRDIEITIPASGTTVVDLRAFSRRDESLLRLETASALGMQAGRDLFGFGDFEEWDTDLQQFEGARWDTSGDSRFLCLSQAYRGTAGLCSVRHSGNSSDSVTATRNRIRVMGDALDLPNKDLTLFGYFKGINAGPIKLVTRYYASVGDLEFGEEDALNHPGGSFGWQPFSADLNMPAEVPVEADEVANQLNARAVRVFIRQSPPASGEALAAFDEIAVIGWEDEILATEELQIPHARDFLRVTGSPGTHRLTLVFGRYVPAAVR